MEAIDIWRTATLLIRQHVDAAGFVAARRADELLTAGDHLGCSVWIKVGRAIGALRREKARAGEAVN